MVEELSYESEIAVDLEHHSTRSFMGISCFIQISTRTKGFVVDVLALRTHIYAVLVRIFHDAEIVKVFHSAPSDDKWLERDFGLYTVNLFDTCFACNALGFTTNSLSLLLHKYCGVISTNKKIGESAHCLGIQPVTRDEKRYGTEWIV